MRLASIDTKGMQKFVPGLGFRTILNQQLLTSAFFKILV
jgi:hypothetical protein